ncbi:MAG: PEP-CTERM sorting domain-containing protein, partial [Planctomycetaceae bacterium]|nr:PEP-CTERM sorting domain-containing protein [Planctomycetaceae bacterium]
LIAAKATLALNPGRWLRLFRLIFFSCGVKLPQEYHLSHCLKSGVHFSATWVFDHTGNLDFISHPIGPGYIAYANTFGVAEVYYVNPRTRPGSDYFDGDTLWNQVEAGTATRDGDNMMIDISPNHQMFWIYDGYISGDAISGSITWFDQDFASMGLNIGVYDWTWGNDAASDSLTVNVGQNSVPEPSIVALFAAGLFCIGFARRRKA